MFSELETPFGKISRGMLISLGTYASFLVLFALVQLGFEREGLISNAALFMFMLSLIGYALDLELTAFEAVGRGESRNAVVWEGAKNASAEYLLLALVLFAAGVLKIFPKEGFAMPPIPQLLLTAIGIAFFAALFGGGLAAAGAHYAKKK